MVSCSRFCHPYFGYFFYNQKAPFHFWNWLIISYKWTSGRNSFSSQLVKIPFWFPWKLLRNTNIFVYELWIRNLVTRLLSMRFNSFTVSSTAYIIWPVDYCVCNSRYCAKWVTCLESFSLYSLRRVSLMLPRKLN